MPSSFRHSHPYRIKLHDTLCHIYGVLVTHLRGECEMFNTWSPPSLFESNMEIINIQMKTFHSKLYECLQDANVGKKGDDLKYKFLILICFLL